MRKRGAYTLLSLFFVTGLAFLVFSKESLVKIDAQNVRESIVFVDSASMILQAREKFLDLYTAGGDTMRCNSELWRGEYADKQFVQLLRQDPTVVLRVAPGMPSEVLGLSNDNVSISPDKRIESINSTHDTALLVGVIISVLSIIGLVATFVKK